MTRRDELAVQAKILRDRGMAQADIAAELGISQPRVSRLLSGRTGHEARNGTGAAAQLRQLRERVTGLEAERERIVAALRALANGIEAADGDAAYANQDHSYLSLPAGDRNSGISVTLRENQAFPGPDSYSLPGGTMTVRVILTADVSEHAYVALSALAPGDTASGIDVRLAPDSAVLTAARDALARHLHGADGSLGTSQEQARYWLTVAADVAHREGS